MRPFAVFVGEATRFADLTSKSGKRFIAVTVEGAPQNYSSSGEGKSFRPKVEVCCYRNQDGVMQIKAGTQVVATGEIEARTFEYNGKHYGKLMMMGMVEPVGGAAPAPTAPASRPAASQAPAAAAAPAPIDEDDDVPF